MLREATYIIDIGEDEGPKKKHLSVQGYGLHSGSLNTLTLQKIKKKSWLEFVTKNEGLRFSAPALWTRLSGTTRSTALVLRGDSKIRFELRTIEHFMAAAFIYDLQGYEVQVSSDHMDAGILEVPILDGSSQEWKCLKKLASKEIPEMRPVWIAVKDFLLEDGQKRVMIRKADSLDSTHYQCSVDFGANWQQKKNFSIQWLNPEPARLIFENETGLAFDIRTRSCLM
jgi:UDP-3-O-acyl-N-acetylglucosamine deacetylase